MDIASIRRDSASLENGMWIDGILGPDMKPIEGLKLKVRGTDSDAYTFAMSRKQVSADGADIEKDGGIAPEAMLRFRLELLHEVVLLDWDGVTRDGQSVVYDPALAQEWVTSSDYRSFADIVARAAAAANRKVREKTEAAAGN